jgi:hypothetical protein
MTTTTTTDAKKIEKLTPEQAAYLSQFRQKWLEVGTCTLPADRTKAEATITKMYKFLDKPKPRFLWFDSPLACNLVINLFSGQLSGQLSDQLYGQLHGQLSDQLYGQLHDQLYDQLRGPLYDQLYGQLSDQLRGQLSDQLSDQLRGPLRGQLHDQLYGQLSDQLRGQLSDQLSGQLRGPLYGQLYDQLHGQLYDQLRGQLHGQPVEYKYTYWWGQQDAFWIAFYVFCGYIGVKYSAKEAEHLSWHKEIAESMMWWWPYENLVICCERPNVVQFDRRGRLHCSDGPAVSFRDGWAVYAWHGVRVPDWIILHPEKIESGSIQQEQNAEIRRVLIERYGDSRYLAESRAKVISSDIDTKGNLRELLVLEWADGREMRMLKVINSTPEPDGHNKVYYLGVPSDIRTVAEGVAWTFGLTPKEYQVIQES